MKLTYASAADWATRDPAPDPAETEVYAAQRNLDIVSTMMGYADEAEQPRSRAQSRGFAYMLEEWILPAVGAAALLVGVILLSPSTIYGDSIGWRTSHGATFDIDTVNFSNLDGRILTAIICSLIGFVLLTGNWIAHLISKNTRGDTVAASVIMMLSAAVGLLYIWLLGREGYDGFAVPVGVMIGIVVAGSANIVLFYVHKRARKAQEGDDALPEPQRQARANDRLQVQRLAEAQVQFRQLPPERQHEIMADRAQAVQMLTQRGILHPQIEHELPRLGFGELTSALNAQSSPRR